MHDTASTALSAFDIAAILVVASALLGWFNHHFLRLPHVIGLTVMGALGAIGLTVADAFIPGVTLDDWVADTLQQARPLLATCSPLAVASTGGCRSAAPAAARAPAVPPRAAGRVSLSLLLNPRGAPKPGGALTLPRRLATDLAAGGAWPPTQCDRAAPRLSHIYEREMISGFDVSTFKRSA